MGSRRMWRAGPAGEAEGRDALLRSVRVATRGDRVEAMMIVCTMCGSEQFELNGECWCIGCCLPLGVADGREEGFPGQYGWRLESSEAPLPSSLSGPWSKPEDVWCPEGHGVFETAIAVALTEERRICGLSMGLRCPEDGLLTLYIDNAGVMPTGSETATFPVDYLDTAVSFLDRCTAPAAPAAPAAAADRRGRGLWFWRRSRKS